MHCNVELSTILVHKGKQSMRGNVELYGKRLFERAMEVIWLVLEKSC